MQGPRRSVLAIDCYLVHILPFERNVMFFRTFSEVTETTKPYVVGRGTSNEYPQCVFVKNSSKTKYIYIETLLVMASLSYNMREGEHIT